MGSAGITPAKVLRKYHVIPATKSLNTPALLFRHDPIKNPRRAPRHNRPAKRGGTQPFRPEGGRDTTRLFGRAQKKQTQITETARALSPRREHGKPRKGARLPWYKKRFRVSRNRLLPCSRVHRRAGRIVHCQSFESPEPSEIQTDSK